MLSNDWKIHKRLLDAGGLGDTIYICQGRGSGKTETERRMIEELQAKGKTVIPLRLEDIHRTRTKPVPVPDLDLLGAEQSERAQHWIEALFEAQEKLRETAKPRYIPEYELFKNFYVLDEDEPVWKKDNWPRPYPYWPFIYW